LRIVDLEVDKVLTRIKAKDVHIELTQSAKEFLIEKGYDPQYGARPMRRAVERFLEDPLAEELLRGTVKPGDKVEVVAVDGKLLFQVPESHPQNSATAPASEGTRQIRPADAHPRKLSSAVRQSRACRSAWWKGWRAPARPGHCADQHRDRACASQSYVAICVG
jgi:hypothetical protein